MADGTVVTWGMPSYGGDSTWVQDQLKEVQLICAAKWAFAAILSNGKLVTWGRSGYSHMVVTAQLSKISSEMSCRFVAQLTALLPFWQTEPWWHGADPTLVGIAHQCNISWCSANLYKQCFFCPFWQTERLWHRVIKTMAVTVRACRVSSIASRCRSRQKKTSSRSQVVWWLHLHSTRLYQEAWMHAVHIYM